jgi:hypothetical protein
MEFDDSERNIAFPRPAQPASSPEAKPGSTAALVSVICGIAACVLNLFVITAPLGFLFGLIGLASGIAARAAGGSGRAGLVLAFVSLLILVIYLASLLVPFVADPTARLMRS